MESKDSVAVACVGRFASPLDPAQALKGRQKAAHTKKMPLVHKKRFRFVAYLSRI